MSTSPYHISPFQNTVQNGGNITGSITAPSQNLWSSTISDTSDASIHIRGNAVVTGTLSVGGQNITKSIDERLSAIEERLCILRVDEKLADRWAELGEMRKRYRELEQECWEKDEIIRLLKGEKA
jgi:hypothetical protein